MQKAIEFLKQYSNYMVGQVAVFGNDAADRLVHAKVAKPFVPKLGQAPRREAIKQMIKKSK